MSKTGRFPCLDKLIFRKKERKVSKIVIASVLQRCQRIGIPTLEILAYLRLCWPPHHPYHQFSSSSSSWPCQEPGFIVVVVDSDSAKIVKFLSFHLVFHSRFFRFSRISIPYRPTTAIVLSNVENVFSSVSKVVIVTSFIATNIGKNETTDDSIYSGNPECNIVASRFPILLFSSKINQWTDECTGESVSPS